MIQSRGLLICHARSAFGIATMRESASTADGQAGAFDFAFIDADKKSYAVYFEKCLRLVRKGGIIAIDNTLWRTTLAHGDMHFFNCDAMREFNEKIFADSRVTLSVLPVADGLTLALVN